MEPNEEVLFVIQAESGEEIAVPLAALDEQHQEVILDSDGSTSAIGLQGDAQNVPEQGISSVNETSNDLSDMEVETIQPESPVKKPAFARKKQKRKEKLVYLPLFDDDNKLEFQIVDQPITPTREESKRKPRKEYRTKRRLAALSASNLEQQKNQQTAPKETKKDCVEEDPPPPPSPPKRVDISPPQPTQRRTRLSNSCRVATGKMYKCNDCDFSTERINNIILHMKETCPKIKKET